MTGYPIRNLHAQVSRNQERNGDTKHPTSDTQGALIKAAMDLLIDLIDKDRLRRVEGSD